MRTQCAALVACLNIGVDPPDVVKPSPCARMECWIDPESMLPAKALKAIGGRLQLQYERWHERAKYKTLLDPTAEELRKTLYSLRRVANEERVLLHYNGHGVPKPTTNGEIWVYNKGYTQYIPVSLYDLQTWMGGVTAPSMYVFDCSHAGIVVHAFQHFLAQRKEKMVHKLKVQKQQQQQQPAHHTPKSQSAAAGSSGAPAADDADARVDEAQLAASLADPCRHILLASCSASESLPLSPDLPADLFTACLTTPIKMALRWFVSRSLLNSHSDVGGGGGGSGIGIGVGVGGASPPSGNRARLYDLIEKLPGMRKPNNRKTPFGELNWIFTAITDSIAWNILPRDVFHKLFRQDLLVSSLFRNFLLAQRIMASYNCTVISVPAITPTHLHPLWQCWDLASDIALSQLERFEKHGTPFTPSTFFEEQLTSFEIWLDSPVNQSFVGGAAAAARPPPMQLPVVLQVLLSTDHRLRALQLLARFMDKGSWAINLALSVGIFPYVQKLLQSPSKELREVLVFIWAKIFALDRGVAADLSKVEYAHYFIQHLTKYQPTTSSSHANSAVGTGNTTERRSLHSRNSSVAPSPLIRPTHSYSLSSTPALTPFHTFANPSGTSSGAATPRIAAEATQTQAQAHAHALPFKSFPASHLQPHSASSGGTTDTSPQMADAASRSSNPPPLDLPPTNSNGDVRLEATHSAHLRDHPTATAADMQHDLHLMHMRAQPLHDPAARLGDGYPAGIGATNDAAASALPSAPHTSPPLHAARVPFPLDLTTHPVTASPLLSPHHPHAIGVAKPSPVLGGVAFSPTSPMLSPQGGRGEHAAAAEKDAKRTDELSDAHHLTVSTHRRWTEERWGER